MMSFTRRQAMGALAASAAGAAATPPKIDATLIERHDGGVARYLEGQNTDRSSPFHGGLADAYGLYAPGTGSGLIHAFTCAYVTPGSRYFKSAMLLERIRLAHGLLHRSQNEQGNIYLPITNFNSPPDTAFSVHSVASAAAIGRKYGAPEIERVVEPFLKKAGEGLIAGGVHTPNHRWVVSSALAQLHELYPDPRYLKRIEQWLAEGVDIDADGQYNERSTLVYNMVSNRAMLTMAIKLSRPDLFGPVKRNLESMLYLMHANGEVVTDISTRQDRNERGEIGVYWWPLQVMALRERNGQYAALARRYASKYATLGLYLEYPQLLDALPADAPLPENYQKEFPVLKLVRMRRGPTSATLFHNGQNVFFALRRGEAVINAVRFATAFFGKGQFVPQRFEKRGDGFHFSQSLEGPYFQPLEPSRHIAPEAYGASRRERRQSEICRLEQSATLTELPKGFRLRVEASGTDWVPLAIEINLRPGGKLEGCEAVEKVADAWILAKGQASYSVGGDRIRFGPGLKKNTYTQVRGAEAKLTGPSVYLTGHTPFDHTIDFEWE